MSSNLMDTEPGGEQTQYEGEHTHIEPHSKEQGQLGSSSEGTQLADKSSAVSNDKGKPNTHGITPAEKIRYGQSIQEGGMGGKTTGSEGQVGREGGFGGTEALDGDEKDAAAKRREAGYGGAKDMDRSIGA